MKRASLSAWSLAVCCGVAAAVAFAQPAHDTKPAQPVTPAQPSTPAPAPKQTLIPGKGRPVEPPPELSPEMKAMMEQAAPDEHHKHFEKYVARWEGAMKLWMAPGTEPTETVDTMMVRWDPGMGQRFIILDHTSRMMGLPFRGSATWGYNKMTKKYESCWRDNMGTGMSMSYGTLSDDGKTLTFAGEMDSPQGRVKTREVFTWTSDETFKFEMFSTGSDGKENKSIDATYTKKGFEAKPGQVVKPAVKPAEKK